MLLVAVAGFLCGAVNAVAGGGSLLLFPAMVATGMGTLAANVTNSVATWPGYVGSSLGFREELREHRARLPRLLAATVVGSAAGCAVLLATPEGAFDVVVPWLVLGAASLLALQPRIARRVGAPVGDDPRHQRLAVLGVGLASVYGGYFSAALGVVYLGVLSLTVPGPLRRLNGLKAGLSLTDATVSVLAFSLFGPVRWWAVAAAAPSALVGGYVGSRVARRIDERALRLGIVGVSVAVSVALLVAR